MSVFNSLAAWSGIANRMRRSVRGHLVLIGIWPAIAIIAAAIGWIQLHNNLEAEKHEIEARTLKDAGSLSKSYADNVSHMLEAIDQIILHVKYEWLVTNGSMELETIEKMGLFPPSSVFNVGIVDAQGTLVTSTFRNRPGGYVAGRSSDRPYFTAQRARPDDFLYIGVPVIGRHSEKPVIQFSRKLMQNKGGFAGIVLASVAPEYFTASYDDTIYGHHGLLGIVGSDGIVRVTRSGELVHPPEFQALRSVPRMETASGSALFDGATWFSDKRSRYVSWQRVKGYPLVAIAGIDAQDVFLPYQERREAAIRQAIWMTAALAAFTLAAMGLSMRVAWERHRLGTLQATYRMATEEGEEGFYIARPLRDKSGAIVDFQTIDCNYRGAELFRMSREEFIGRTVSDLYDGRSPHRLMKTLMQAMEDGAFEGELEVRTDGLIATRWVHLKVVRADDEDLAITLRDVSDTKTHFEELERQANEDGLTGLPNRRWVEEYLPTAIANAAQSGALLAVLFLDLDGFKAVNDTMGHRAGDELLKNAARRLKVAVRPEDTVARLGGDEFVVIIESIHHRNDAAHVAERIQQAFRQGFKLSKGVPAVGASIGIGMFPADGADAETLLRSADIAMYSVKTAGKGNYRFYDQKFHEARLYRLEREYELHHALEHDQFVMYYQPRVDISTGKTSSMEALVRWKHPAKGLIGPAEFIPLAEETGAIVALGALIIDKVCAQLASWARNGQSLVPVSINVSPRQFNEANIPQVLSEALRRHRVNPELIELELTEASMMGDSQDVSEALNALQRMGVKLLVDDFGTGYSSLSQLQRLDFDVLKVDRAFTAEVDKTEQGKVFFTAIVTMAHALGMRVVAEGVESMKQARILRALRCDELQGFYISKPLPATERQPVLPMWELPSTA
jgi:diguanylate cyclase (GGDEF)-like protein